MMQRFLSWASARALGRGVRCRLAAVLALMLCMAAGAMAAGIDKVPASRISLRMPDGMQARVHTSAGELNITIDSRQTDWSRVLLQGNDPSMVDVVAGVKAPQDAVYFVMECGSVEYEVLEWLDAYEPGEYAEGDLAEDGQFVAQYVKAYNVVSPYDENTYMYVRWFDAQYEEIRTEKLHFTSAHTLQDGVYAPLRRIASDDILPNYGKQDGVSSDVGEGSVVYTVSRKPSGMERITTAIRVPEGTAACNLTSIYDGKLELPLQDGLAMIERRYPETGAPKETLGLEFWDRNNVLLGYGTVEIQHQTMEMKPWPAYVASWKPVPEANMSVEIDGSSGIKMPYRDGVLSYDYSQISGDPEQLDSGVLTLTVTPPEGAKYVRWNCVGGGEGLLGMRNDEEDAKEMLFWAEPEKISGDIEANSAPLLQTMRTYDGVTLFVPTMPTDLDAGLVYYFAWYGSEEEAKAEEEENQPSEVWWFTETSGPFVTVVNNRMRTSETQIPERFNGAIGIGTENWTLVTERYLQQGENAEHYELRLVDPHGNAIVPGRNTVIYLAYPQGHAYGDGHVYTLRHYDAKGGSEIVTNLTPTAYGLRFEVDSLSPFVLSWVEGAPETVPSNLPKTGDESRMALWMLALMASAIGLLALRRRENA